MSTIDTEAVLQRAKTHPSFRLAARYWTAHVAFDIGDDRYMLEVVDGAPCHVAVMKAPSSSTL